MAAETEILADTEKNGGACDTAHGAALDFFFRSASSVSGFTAERGELTWEEGKLIYRIKGAGSAVSSPEIRVEAGHPYSMLLPLRNTLRIRARNATAAAEWKITVRVGEQKTFEEKNAVTVPVTPESGRFETCYANLSGLGLDGYLRGFRIEAAGAASGTVEIEEISFEREDAVTETAGEILSCLADPERDTVTVTGRLKEEYRDREVVLYDTNIGNYKEELLPGQIAGTAVADGTAFTVTVPFTVRIGGESEMTRLSSLFLAAVDGVKVTAKPFAIENYRDFEENPYAFSLPERSASVTEPAYGAAGDGYTDDTQAIQKAIDAVAAAGGGRVILPGDPESFYGRRYLATNIRLRDSIELVIEKGAVLWQSSRPEDYAYDAVYGHDVVIPGVNWTHAFLCHNLPLIQGDRVSHIKITGGGTIRCMDCGGEDPTGYDIGNLWTGCAHKIHIEPIGLYACTEVEVSDITILRSNGYHFSLQSCRNVYAANLTFKEVTCASGDGISMFAGTQNVMITRLMDLSNDDAVVLVSAYNDPRGLTWWKSDPERDNSIANITVCHSWIQAGHGVTFITWGTDNPDLSRNEIRDIFVYDNVLNEVGTWCDNPYYGESPFTNLETEDYSPVKGVRLKNNKIAIENLRSIQATDLVSDSALRSTSQFRYGDFERRDPLHPEWVAGLSNWTVRENGGTVRALPNDAGYMGVVQGKAMLAQGLFLSGDGHRFTADVRVVSGRARLFAADILTGAVLASAEYTAENFAGGTAWKRVSLTFRGTERNVYLGLEVLTEDGAADLDNCSVQDTDGASVRPDLPEETAIGSLTERVDPHRDPESRL